MIEGLKRVAKGGALALAAGFAMGAKRRNKYRGATAARHAVGRNGINVKRGDKLGRALDRAGDAQGRLTARHGTPYNDRETMMRIRALNNGAHVEIHRDSVTGTIIGRHVVWNRNAVEKMVRPRAA